MSGLLYKDFLVMKKDLLLSGIGMLFFSIPLFLPWGRMLEAQNITSDIINGETMTYAILPLFVYLCIFVIISTLQSGIFVQDERRVWSAYVIATPLRSNGQVLSKYYITLALSFLGVVWGFACDIISMFTSGVYGTASAIYVSLFFVQIFLRAFEMPFLIRFGQKHGQIIKIFTMSVIVFAGMVYALFGRIPNFVSMDSCFEFVLKILEDEKILSTMTLGFVAVFPYAAMLLYYISYKISCRLYRKGAEAYDA